MNQPPPKLWADDWGTAVALAERIRGYLDTEAAERLLAKYYSGSYTGSFYDELVSDEPNRITTDDIAAVALLAVELPGAAVKSLLWDHAHAIAERLQRVPTTPLAEVESEAELQPLWELQEFFEQHVSGVGIGHVRRSKLLAHKRPHLVPIRDRFVLNALVGGSTRPFTAPLRGALREDPAITKRLDALRSAIGRPQLPIIRVLDVVVWMTEFGDAQVPTPKPGP